MSKAEILAELPRLSPEDRGEILMHLWQMQEEAATRRGPTASERNLLDRELAEYEANPDSGSPWSEVEARLRRRS